MPICNKILAIAAISALFAAPSFADGIPGQQVNRGPAPLRAHTMTPPEPGCYLVEGNRWSCPAQQPRYTSTTTQTRRAPAPTTRRYTTSTVRRSAPTTTTRTVTRSAPTVTRRVATTRRTSAIVSNTVTLDLASFSGGVGNGVDGGFYGGGGTIFFAGDKSFSGVLSHRASAFTFQRRSRGGKRGGGGHNCGCMGGGMMGGGGGD